jgi:hypothetical protein
VERLEDRLPARRIDAAPGIGDDDLDPFAPS